MLLYAWHVSFIEFENIDLFADWLIGWLIDLLNGLYAKSIINEHDSQLKTVHTQAWMQISGKAWYRFKRLVKVELHKYCVIVVTFPCIDLRKLYSNQ